jgi:hypothetical protein
MEDEMDRDAEEENEQLQPVDCEPVGWISTDELEDELFNAIMMDSLARGDDESEEIEEIDDFFEGDDDYEDEGERRRALLSLLGTLKPDLAELLGGPPADHR